MRRLHVSAATRSAAPIEMTDGADRRALEKNSRRSSGERMAVTGLLMTKAKAYSAVTIRSRRAACACRSSGNPVMGELPSRSSGRRASSETDSSRAVATVMLLIVVSSIACAVPAGHRA